MDLRGRKLYRSRTDSRLAGVCGGLGEFFEIDPTLIRLLVVAATMMTGLVPGLIAYLVAWIIVPEEPVPAYAPQPPQTEPNSQG
jgi:phage shock protein C